VVKVEEPSFSVTYLTFYLYSWFSFFSFSSESVNIILCS